MIGHKTGENFSATPTRTFQGPRCESGAGEGGRWQPTGRWRGSSRRRRSLRQRRRHKPWPELTTTERHKLKPTRLGPAMCGIVAAKGRVLVMDLIRGQKGASSVAKRCATTPKARGQAHRKKVLRSAIANARTQGRRIAGRARSMGRRTVREHLLCERKAPPLEAVLRPPRRLGRAIPLSEAATAHLWVGRRGASCSPQRNALPRFEAEAEAQKGRGRGKAPRVRVAAKATGRQGRAVPKKGKK